MARSLGGVTVLSSIYHANVSGSSLRAKALVIAIHSWTRPTPAPFAGQSDTCGTGRAQLNPSVMPGRAAVFFSRSSITIHVSSWNPAQQKCWSCDDSFRSPSAEPRGRPKALYAVRLGVRGAIWCAGQLGWARACVQRGRRPVAPLTIPLRRVFSGANQTSPEASRRGAPPAQCRSPHPEPQGRS